MARPISAFREFPIVKQAYTHVRNHLDIMIRSQNHPGLGAIDPPLWHYMHSCVPEQHALPDLGKNAVAIGARCQEMVKPILFSGQLTPQNYAARIMDSERFDRFIDKWIARELGNRAAG